MDGHCIVTQDFIRNANIHCIPTSHHFHQSLSPVVSLSLGILHDWMRMQMLAKQSSNLPGELEATTRLAAHKLDEEHSWWPVFTGHTHTHTFNSPFSGTTRVSRYQKGKTNLDFTEARDSEWQWHQLGRMQVCTSLQTDNHSSTPPLSFLQAGCHSCHPTNSVKALAAISSHHIFEILFESIPRSSETNSGLDTLTSNS